MKENILSKSLTLAIIIGAIILTAFLVVQNASRVEGSTFQGNDYQGTTTDDTWVTTSPKVLKVGGGALAQVTITTAGTGSLLLVDATTTDVSKRTGNTATSTITLANFGITTTVGTYTFDRTFNRGLIVVWVGTNNASSTITYR